MIEVLVVVALVGIMSAMASVGWKRVVWRVRSTGAAEELRYALMLARSESRTCDCNTGVFFDAPNRRYLRFLDSTGNDIRDGMYTSGEKVLQDWTELPDRMLVYSVNSSIAPVIPLRACGATATTPAATTQSGTFAVVFRPNGQCMATFNAKFGIESFPDDTFRIEILPPTGLVTMER